ncbi:hypothetical protein JN25_19775 [Bacillus sp. BSC154]|nr:hypothetical protein JN25_19775 [Bacillus sp. BSC154]
MKIQEGKTIDLTTWAYSIFTIMGAAGFVSLMWFDIFLTKLKSKAIFILDVSIHFAVLQRIKT